MDPKVKSSSVTYSHLSRPTSTRESCWLGLKTHPPSHHLSPRLACAMAQPPSPWSGSVTGPPTGLPISALLLQTVCSQHGREGDFMKKPGQATCLLQTLSWLPRSLRGQAEAFTGPWAPRSTSQALGRGFCMCCLSPRLEHLVTGAICGPPAWSQG